MYGKELKYPNKNPGFPAAIGPVVVVRCRATLADGCAGARAERTKFP